MEPRCRATRLGIAALAAAVLAATPAPAAAHAAPRPVQATLTLELVADGFSATPVNNYLRIDAPASRSDVTAVLGAPTSGQLFLIPSSMQPGEITRVLREGYDAQKLTQGV